MKINLLTLGVLILGPAVLVPAAPLAAPAAVYSKPEMGAPVIASLKAGTEPVTALGSMPNTPAGWMAVELPGPFEGWIENKDLSKVLDVKPGVSIRLAAKADAPVLAVAEKGDKSSILDQRGKWTQISLEKKLVGYIRLANPSLAATAPAAQHAPAPLARPPVNPGAYGVAGGGQASTMVNLGDGGSSTLPRQFAGKFVTTRRAFAPRRPYDYALNDDAGKRYAYLDISKLLLTEQIDRYVDHPVVVYGAARAVPDLKEMVIQVESLQLK